MQYERLKRGDGATLAFTLDPKPDPFESASYRLRRSTAAGLGDVVTGEAAEYDPASGVVTLVFDPIAEAGWYRLEVQVEPGPVTYPSGGYFTLYVVPDLG